MMDCSRFLADYSEYRDDRLAPSERSRIQRHIAACVRCAHYDRVVREGVEALREAPAVEPMDSFLPRLQHRIYTEDERRRRRRRLPATLTPPAMGVAALVGALAVLPILRTQPEPPRLPAVAAMAPGAIDRVEMPSVFGSGPFFTPAPRANRSTLAGQASVAGSSMHLFDHPSPAQPAFGRLISD